MKRHLLVVSLIILVLLCGCGKNSSYSDAISLFEQGKYEQAIPKFAELGDYKDSREYLSRCKTNTKKLLQGGWMVNGTESTGHAVAFRENVAVLAFLVYGKAYVNSKGGYEISDDAVIHCAFSSDWELTFAAENGKLTLYSALGDEYTYFDIDY